MAGEVLLHAELVRIETCRQTNAARNALRRIRVGALEQAAAARQGVERGGARITADAADGVGAELIGEDKQDIRPHASAHYLLLSRRSTWRLASRRNYVVDADADEDCTS